MNRKTILVDPKANVDFYNQVDFCVGTGRMGLALHREYQEQLKMVQEHIGFKHIRGHGLFCDDMAIYQVTADGTVEYNYTYLDRVMDSYREVGLKPFIELGFMPEKMASGTQTVFYWKGNTTPPADYDRWTVMVQELLRHLMSRYGREEVLTWPIEVWNEPNLPGFWEHADMQEYFKLFHKTFLAIKEVDASFRVGGPAICGVNDEVWIREFMTYCRDNKLAVDFVTRHHYTTELPEEVGHYGYPELSEAEDGFANLHTTREIIDSFAEYKGMQIHITEFNTSYIPNAPIHDTNQNAAYLAQQLSRLGEDNESYSYWTFGDVFEERGVPFTPFHGGFGLVANGCIPKPTFWTFAFFKKLKEKPGHCIYKDDSTVMMQYEDGTVRGIAWNKSNQRTGLAYELELTLPGKEEGVFVTKTVDEAHCNPLKVWHDLGEPANPTAEENDLIKQAAYPFVETRRVKVRNDELKTTLKVAEHAVIYFEWKRNQVKADRGYSYERTMQYPQMNPITRLDYPDIDAIRVGDTYYMVSTTMHFMPGCEILRSYDLRNWEHAAYVYDVLDSTPAQKLEGNEDIYGKGMWAASLRYHKGTFYVCFVANDTHKTYLYTATDVTGPWKKQTIDGFYHDCSLLFDDDDRIYIVYGNKEIWLTELNAEMTGPKEGGIHRMIVSDAGNPSLGYEGSHLYKINGKYYVFFIHSLRDRWKRVEACFMADSLEGEFVGGDCFNDDRAYLGSGVAQGGIVDTPDGKWYAILFQDSGAVGRLPILLPVHFENDKPVFGVDGMVPETMELESTRPDYVYEPLVGSDDFKTPLRPKWQYNHEPKLSLVSQDTERGIWQVQTEKICKNLTQAPNTITQRMTFPGCAGEVTVDGTDMKEGDFAGLCALQARYGFVGLTRRNGSLSLIVHTAGSETPEPGFRIREDLPEIEWAEIPVDGNSVKVKLETDFENGKDLASFYYYKCDKDRPWFGRWEKVGPDYKLQFRLDHFTGCRFGLVNYATKEAGGIARFSDFVYRNR